MVLALWLQVRGIAGFCQLVLNTLFHLWIHGDKMNILMGYLNFLFQYKCIPKNKPSFFFWKITNVVNPKSLEKEAILVWCVWHSILLGICQWNFSRNWIKMSADWKHIPYEGSNRQQVPCQLGDLLASWLLSVILLSFQKTAQLSQSRTSCFPLWSTERNVRSVAACLFDAPHWLLWSRVNKHFTWRLHEKSSELNHTVFIPSFIHLFFYLFIQHVPGAVLWTREKAKTNITLPLWVLF